MLRTVTATRYVMALREGGSLPGLVEAEDSGLYVVKFRGAGQGPRVLIAELLAGELARALGLPVPELVFLELDAALGRAEPDPEIRELLKASVGLNLALDYLPGASTFDPVADPPPSAERASIVVLFDAFATNVDRTAKNPNMLWWHKDLWLIDHGASLHFQHGWEARAPLAGSGSRFPSVRQHVLLPWAKELARAATLLERTFTRALFEERVSVVPETWLDAAAGFPDMTAHRAAYVRWFEARMAALPHVLEEAERARATLV